MWVALTYQTPPEGLCIWPSFTRQVSSATTGHDERCLPITECSLVALNSLYQKMLAPLQPGIRHK